MFYLDAEGKKQDAALHADMLDNNPEADAAFERLLEATRAVKGGMSAEEAQRL